MNPGVAMSVGSVIALICTILAVILIVPAKRRAGLPKFFQVLHDIFNFKFLIVEKILQFCYILSTLVCVFGGFFMLFGSIDYYYYSQSTFGTGLVVMLAGPILIRVVYEFSMMVILLIKNVIEINNKLKNQNPEKAQSVFNAPIYSAPVAEVPYAPVQQPYDPWTFCTRCGTRYDRSQGVCPCCGNTEQ